MDRLLGTDSYMAQRDHWCDRCCTHIQPGEMYERLVYTSRRWGIITMKYHIQPSCDYPEEPDYYKESLERVVEEVIKEAA